MQNFSGGAKPKEMQKTLTVTNNKSRYKDGPHHSKNYHRCPSALIEAAKHKQNSNIIEEWQNKFSKNSDGQKSEIDCDKFSTKETFAARRNCSSFSQQQINPSKQKRIESIKITDSVLLRTDNFGKQIGNANTLPLQANVLIGQRGRETPFHFVPNNYVYSKRAADGVQMSANSFYYSKSNRLPHSITTSFQDLAVYSDHKRLENLRSSLLEKHNQQMRMKEKEIAHSNDDTKKILRTHLSILDKKKNIYIRQMENIFKKLCTKPIQLNLIKDEFDKENTALMENCWLSAYRQDIFEALISSQILIVTGEVGYGKSTLLPLYASEICSNMGSIVSCQLLHVTVMTLAYRLAELLGTPLGKDVGYNTGKDKTVSSSTHILFMTYHCLLKETLDTPFLSAYSCIILDDCQDRSVEADVFLCKIKEILSQRPNFKLILISSNSDDRFEKFFGNELKVTVISLPNITIPVKVCWNSPKNPYLYIERAIELVKSIHLQKKSGNVIVFLTTAQETQKACALVEKNLPNEILCFSLHSKTSIDEINKIFSVDSKRKIIFSTECAESLISLPNIYFIIDSGKMKEKVYNADKRQSIVSTSFISKERAERRRQLAGHVQGGCCYRLYTESIYATEIFEKSVPLIVKLNPANLVLTLLHHKIAVPFDANFIYPLEKEVLQAGTLELKNCGAVKDDTLTKLGKTMAVMPFELRQAKLVALGIENRLSFETIVIALLSSLNTPIFNTSGKSMDVGKHSFFDPDGDYFAILNVYLEWQKQKFSEKWCQANGINHSSLTSLHKKVTETFTVLNIKEHHPQITPRKKLIELICNCFNDNLCVFTGHFRLGYKSLYTGNSMRIHFSSTFCYKNDNPSQYIVYDYAINHGNFDLMINVTPVPDDIVKTLLKNYDVKNEESVVDHQIDFVIIEPVGEMFINRELLGKQGKKLKILEDEIKNTIGCNTVIIDPNVEMGKIEIHTYLEYLEPAKAILLKHLEAYLEKLRCQEEETNISIGNVLMKMSWGQGGMITKVSGTVSKQSFQEKVSNEQESGCSILRNYSIILTWRRRLCKGIGFVTFSCAKDFDSACSILLSKELKICGKDIKISKSRKAPNQFYIEDLLPQTSNEDLKEAIENHIAFKVESATIVCNPPFSTSQDDIEVMKHALLLQFVRYLQYGNLNIHIDSPNSTDTTMTAYLNFDDNADIPVVLSAVKRDRIEKFQDIPLNCEESYRTTIICAPEHYYSVKIVIEKALGIGNCKQLPFITNKFQFNTTLINKGMQLKLLSNDYITIQKLEKVIIHSLEGRKLGGFSRNQLRNLFSHSGQQWLRQVEKATKCYILKNFKQKTLSVCGTMECYDNIMCKIKEYLRNMENEIVSVINIGEKNFNRQVIKTLVTKYGITLKKFIIECSLISVELNVQYGQMTLYGTSDSIKRAEKILASLVSQNQISQIIDENKETCPVCLTVPTPGLLHRLEYCGHLYCFDCLKLLVAEKFIPLKCCKEGCQKELVIEDILDILGGNEEETEKLLYHSLNVYVEKNYEHVKRCSTPDCNMIYDLRTLSSRESSDLWTCPACMKIICTRCNTTEHPGISCDIAKKIKEDDDYSLKVWMANNTNLRKHCPSCKCPIEKNGGCNHMTCWKCQAHLCWLCLHVFGDSNLVYNHLPYCSENQTPFV